MKGEGSFKAQTEGGALEFSSLLEPIEVLVCFF